ncbi:hypothetical protein D1227_04235 [Henriciella mobilis]|uniref:hypothetical protein n=1 Tax=Henriciella mobilis TaxID=2305467 RepID=UPI000E676652|nr:hypothetical protein [Henriciella mobilis]RIJ17474.1 hypothetical protein D1231_04315 [Henriciella mobilis]RIJ25539.1 hypothetical protein D1227_04235 [Henriciella mobilis]
MADEAFERGLPIGIAVGIALGAAFGAALGNMAFIGLGLPIGLALSPVFGEARMKTESEDKTDEGGPDAG